MSQTYFAILTAIGEAKLANATALGTTLQLTQMGIGDGNGSTPLPNRSQTALVRENRRAPLNRLFVDPANASQIIAEQVIPLENDERQSSHGPSEALRRELVGRARAAGQKRPVARRCE